MSRRAAYEEKYTKYGLAFASDILSSIARCGAAGRTGDPDLIEAAREAHRRLMKAVRAALA